MSQELVNQEVKEGDIFYASWGYDQTNIDFVKVVSLSKSGKSAKIVKIGQKLVESTGYMSENVLPDPDRVIDGSVPRLVRIKTSRHSGEVYLGGGDSWNIFDRFDGKPLNQTHYH